MFNLFRVDKNLRERNIRLLSENRVLLEELIETQEKLCNALRSNAQHAKQHLYALEALYALSKIIPDDIMGPIYKEYEEKCERLKVKSEEPFQEAITAFRSYTGSEEDDGVEESSENQADSTKS